jgi:hypothetical protein
MSRTRLTDRVAKTASFTERLDKIASELEQVDPRLALAIDQISDHLDKRGMAIGPSQVKSEVQEKLEAYFKTNGESLSKIVENKIDSWFRSNANKTNERRLFRDIKYENGVTSLDIASISIPLPKKFTDIFTKKDMAVLDDIHNNVWDDAIESIEDKLEKAYKDLGWHYVSIFINFKEGMIEVESHFEAKTSDFAFKNFSEGHGTLHELLRNVNIEDK